MAIRSNDELLAQAILRAMDKSAAVLETAADGGDREAVFALGIFHLLGRGVDRDLDEALKYLRSAAEAGDSQAELIKRIAAEELARERIESRDIDIASTALKDAKRRRKFPKPRIVKTG